MRDIILAVVLVVLAPLSLFRPFIGILGWAWVSYFNPHQFAWGFTRTLPVAYLIGVPTLVGLLFTSKKKLPHFTLQTGLLLALWLWFGLSTLAVYYSPIFAHHFSETLYRLTLVSKILLMSFVALMLVIDRERLRWWLLTTAGIFAFFAFKSVLFGILTGGNFRIQGPENSFIADNNDFALAMNMALPMFWALAATEASPGVRRLFRFAIVAGIISVLLTYSRGGLLGLAVVILGLILKSKRRVIALSGLLVLALLFVTFTPAKWMARMSTITTAAEVDASAKGRLTAWRLATYIAMESPLVGGGFNTFTAEVYDRYGLDVEKARVAHSIWFQVLGEHGFVGLALFVGLIFSALFNAMSIARRFRGNPETLWLAKYADMAQISLLAYITAGTFVSRAYFDLSYQLIAIVIVLKYLARKQETVGPAEVSQPAVVGLAEGTPA